MSGAGRGAGARTRGTRCWRACRMLLEINHQPPFRHIASNSLFLALFHIPTSRNTEKGKDEPSRIISCSNPSVARIKVTTPLPNYTPRQPLPAPHPPSFGAYLVERRRALTQARFRGIDVVVHNVRYSCAAVLLAVFILRHWHGCACRRERASPYRPLHLRLRHSVSHCF